MEINLLWIEELVGKKMNIAIDWDIQQNFLYHLFFPNRDSFVISKFLWEFFKRNPDKYSDFSYEKFVSVQINLLSIENLQNNYHFILDPDDKETSLALIIFREVYRHYSLLLWKEKIKDQSLVLYGDNDLVQAYLKMKDDLIKNISYFPENLSWHTAITNTTLKNDSFITFNRLISQVTNHKTKEVKTTKYAPKRWLVRFFLFHFFWYAEFSEERNDVVILGTIFNPENIKPIDRNWCKIFKGWQYDIIASILENNNTLWIMSTGSGKSITFLLSWMLKKGTTFVVAPLKSLIEDQFFNLEKKFFLSWITGKIHSWLDDNEKNENTKKLQSGFFKLFYCAPERLQIKKFIQIVNNGLKENTDDNLKISQIVVDEAHCLSEWGHDFRFSYLNVNVFKDFLKHQNVKEIPIIGLTATASEIVRDDIVQYLEINKVIEEESLNRKNISMEIIPIENSKDKPKAIVDLLQNKMDDILWNVANLQKRNIQSVRYRDENWFFANWWICFTIYGAIGSKTSEDSIAQSSEWLWKYLKNYYSKDNGQISFFCGDNSTNTSIKTCPLCGGSDIITSKERNWKGYFVKYNNIEDRYSDKIYKIWKYEKLFPDNSEGQKNEFYVCNNPACGWISCDEEKNKWKNKPVMKDEKELMGKELWIQNKDRENIKMKIQEDFKQNKIGLLCATKWFWMGIDKSNIRYVIHTTLSGSLEAYYQEIGRAWRDRNHSHSVLLFSGPCEQCLQETEYLKRTPKCIENAEKFQYQKCCYDQDGQEISMCDIARQWKMIISPTTIEQQWKNPFQKKIVFLYDFLDCTEMDLNKEIEGTNKTLQKHLIDHLNPNLSHPLEEFWQLYLFYHDFIAGKIWEVNNDGDLELLVNPYNIVKDEKSDWDVESNGFEKLIYRLMSMKICTRYFKEYQNEKCVFHLIKEKKSESFSIEFIDKYCKEKLLIEQWLEKAFTKEAWNYPCFQEWLESKDDIIKGFWKLIYWNYQKVAKQRTEMLTNLYNSIRETVSEHQCFRHTILKRLSGIQQQQDDEKCKFCSWCIDDTTHFQVYEGLLIIDSKITKHNEIVRKQQRGETLTEQEKKEIESYNLSVDIENEIRSEFNQIENKDLDWVFTFIQKVEKEKLDITALIQRKLEQWIFNPNYYLLSAYFSKDPQRQKRDFEEMLQYLTIGNIDLAKYFYELWKKLYNKHEDLIESFRNVSQHRQEKCYFDLWIYVQQHHFTEDQFLKLWYLVSIDQKWSIKTKKERSNYMQEQKEKHANAYAEWKEEDDKKLEELYNSWVIITELMKIFQRNRWAIRARLKKLWLIEKE